jgi:hypothetical protein
MTAASSAPCDFVYVGINDRTAVGRSQLARRAYTQMVGLVLGKLKLTQRWAAFGPLDLPPIGGGFVLAGG